MLDLVVYSEEGLARANDMQIADSLDYFSPDVVIVPSDEYRYEMKRNLTDSIPLTCLDSRARTLRVIETSEGIRLVQAPTVESLSALTQQDEPTETYVLSNLLGVDIDPTRLETTLEGREEYEDAFPQTELLSSYYHLTGKANPSYRAQWGTLEVQGVLPGANQQQSGSVGRVACLSLQADGIVTKTIRQISAFGLQALNQVGETRSQSLRDAGFRSPDQIASASLSELRDLSGFGRSTAETVHRSAQAFTDGEVYRYGDRTLPNPEPIFVDIETDGLNPTMVWLIGVLDRQGGETYLSFLETDPNNPGAAVESFLSWFVENSGNRPVVAYNGFNFDFPVIAEQIQQHCPQYLTEWQDAWTFDPYYWAVREHEAILPGRTDKLEDVAPALGWETMETGLSGETVARLFQAYMANPGPETELDWDRHERYCEDDVRSLAFVYDAIADASQRMMPGGSTEESQTQENTAQGRLSDF